MAKVYTLDGDKLKITTTEAVVQDFPIDNLLTMKQMHEEEIIRAEEELVKVEVLISEYNKLK